MATMSDIVTAALKRIFVIGPDQDPTADESADGLAALNDMMHAWAVEGCDIHHTTLDLNDTFPLEDHHVQGVKAMLALRLSGDYTVTPHPMVVEMAGRGWRALQADYGGPEPLRQDSALSDMPSQRRLSRGGGSELF